VRLSLLSILIFLFFPFSVQSLGLGELSIHSTLNSPLDAKIDLKSATPQDIESLDIRIASDRDFKRSDIEKVDLLQKLKFNLITNDGSPYIHITTNSVLREPFINFLIDIQWYSGRLLREYTVLLDLPEVAGSYNNSSKPNSKRSYGSSKPKPKPKSSSNIAKHSSLTSKKFNGPSTSLTYGPTLETDTLWSVASQMRPSIDISMAQMMLAIQRENPSAFNKNNINGLMSGYTLIISSKAALTQIDKADAYSQVKDQENDWKDIVNNTSKNISVDTLTTPVKDKQTNKQPSIDTQDDSKLEILSNKVANDAEDKTGILKDRASIGINKAEFEEKIALYEERIQTQTQENEELKNRITELEKLIDKRENLVELKSENMALIQEQQKEKIESLANEDRNLEKEQHGYVFNKALFTENNQSTLDSTDDLQNDVVETDVVETDEVIVVVENKPEVETELKEQVSSKQQPSEASNLEKSALEKTVAAKNKPEIVAESPKLVKPVVDTYKPESTLDIVLGIFSDIYKNYFVELLVAGGAFILLLLVSLFTRKKKVQQEDDFQESILTNSSIIEDQDFENENDNLDTADMGDSTGLENETSFLSDFSSSELDGLQPDDVDADPISEADVFMVYGRYDQAEEMLNGAIERNPERLDYQMKLLEVFHGDKRQDGFVKQSAVVKALIESSDSNLEESMDWQKVGELGKDFELGDSLGTSDKASNNSSPKTIDSDFSLDNDDLDIADSVSEELSDDEIDVDDLERQLNEFEAMLNDDEDLGDTASLTDSNDDLSLVQADSLPSVDDLPSLDDIDTQEQNSSDELSLDEQLINDDQIENLPDSIEEAEVDNSLDEMELDIEELSETIEEPELAIEVESSEVETSIDNIDLDFEALSDSFEDQDGSLEEESAKVEDSLDDMEFDLDDLADEISLEDNLNLDDITDELDAISTDLSLEDSPEIEDEIVELDKIGSTLDLAKARIEMGDDESRSSAIKALEIVIEDGNEEQKAVAQKLLDLTK
jgi:pilus assembly protein FimV